MDKNVAQGDKEQGERCPRPELGTANGINVTDQLPPGVEANHTHLTDESAVFPPKFEMAQGEIERPPPQGEQHPRPGCDTINDTIVTDQTPPGAEVNHIRCSRRTCIPPDKLKHFATTTSYIHDITTPHNAPIINEY
jgi:hypothetical protein